MPAASMLAPSPPPTAPSPQMSVSLPSLRAPSTIDCCDAGPEAPPVAFGAAAGFAPPQALSSNHPPSTSVEILFIVLSSAAAVAGFAGHAQLFLCLAQQAQIGQLIDASDVCFAFDGVEIVGDLHVDAGFAEAAEVLRIDGLDDRRQRAPGDVDLHLKGLSGDGRRFGLMLADE